MKRRFSMPRLSVPKIDLMPASKAERPKPKPKLKKAKARRAPRGKYFVVRDHASAIKLYPTRAVALEAAADAAKASNDGVRVFVGRLVAEGHVKTVKEFQWKG